MRTVTFHIKRYDPARDAKGTSRVEAYEIPYDTSLTVLEAAELAKLLEEKWGVSAAAAVAVAAAPGGGAEREA